MKLKKGCFPNNLSITNLHLKSNSNSVADLPQLLPCAELLLNFFPNVPHYHCSRMRDDHISEPRGSFERTKARRLHGNTEFVKSGKIFLDRSPKRAISRYIWNLSRGNAVKKRRFSVF